MTVGESNKTEQSEKTKSKPNDWKELSSLKLLLRIQHIHTRVFVFVCFLYLKFSFGIHSLSLVKPESKRLDHVACHT